MPTYDYQCAGCKHVFEIFEGIHAASAKPCPKCKKGKAKRRFTAPAGVIFKGAGFYVTDSKGSSASGPSPSQKKTGRKKVDTSEKKTDSSSEKTEKK